MCCNAACLTIPNPNCYSDGINIHLQNSATTLNSPGVLSVTSHQQ